MHRLLFALWERRDRAPLLQLFRIRDFVGANLLTLLLYAALGGGLFFLPLMLIQLQHCSATAASAALPPFILIRGQAKHDDDGDPAQSFLATRADRRTTRSPVPPERVSA